MPTIDQRRLKVWQALSQLFLDTEIDDKTFACIAQTVLDSGYSPQDVQIILWGEVFPVLEANLRSVAGEWVGWTDDWLIKHIKLYEGSIPPARSGRTAAEIRRCWEQVASHLSPMYRSSS